MRRIRFSPDMIVAIRRGEKTMTFRRSPKLCGVYIVEDGSYPRHKHVDTGLRIFIFHTFWVENVGVYASQNYKEEGFANSLDVIKKLEVLYGGFVPRVGFGHQFLLIQSRSELEDLMRKTGGKP